MAEEYTVKEIVQRIEIKVDHQDEKLGELGGEIRGLALKLERHVAQQKPLDEFWTSVQKVGVEEVGSQMIQRFRMTERDQVREAARSITTKWIVGLAVTVILTLLSVIGNITLQLVHHKGP